MFGKTRHGHAYYSCYPAGNNADRLDRYPTEHPKAIYVREDSLTEALDQASRSTLTATAASMRAAAGGVIRAGRT